MRTSRKFFVVLATTLLACCARETSVEEQVRETLTLAEQGAEARDLSAVMQLVSKDYSDERGYDKAQIANLMRGYFLLNQSVHLLMRVESLEFPADELAQARVTVGMLGTRGEAGEDWSLAADIYEFDVELLREGDEWKLRHADWRRARE